MELKKKKKKKRKKKERRKDYKNLNQNMQSIIKTVSLINAKKTHRDFHEQIFHKYFPNHVLLVLFE